MRPGPPTAVVKTAKVNITSRYTSTSTSSAFTTLTHNSTSSPVDILTEDVEEEIIDDDNSTIELLQDIMPANFSLLLEELNITMNEFLQSDNMGEILNKIGLGEEPADGYSSASENLGQKNRTQRKPRRVFRGGSSRKYYKKGSKVNANETSHNNTNTMSKITILTKFLENKTHTFPNGNEIHRVDFTKIHLILPTTATKSQVKLHN